MIELFFYCKYNITWHIRLVSQYHCQSSALKFNWSAYCSYYKFYNCHHIGARLDNIRPLQHLQYHNWEYCYSINICSSSIGGSSFAKYIKTKDKKINNLVIVKISCNNLSHNDYFTFPTENVDFNLFTWQVKIWHPSVLLFNSYFHTVITVKRAILYTGIFCDHKWQWDTCK